MEYIQPQTIITDANFSFILLFKLIAFVMANHRSTVIITKVNTDKWLANTVRKPAALQPEPVRVIENFKLKIDCIDSKLIKDLD